jgi:hypothetical protein
MEWLEIIKVRMGGAGDQAFDAEYLNQMKKSLTAPALLNARVYVNVSIPNDLVIILTWLKAAPTPWGSDLARRLTEEFKQFGLVDYSGWSGLD